MLDDEKQLDHVRRIAREAVRKLLDEKARQEWQTKCLAALPMELRDLAEHSNANQFLQALQAYLLKLSEHPAADLQLLATNYLERYAANNIEWLRTLQPYFVSVLSRVSRARVAKARVLKFLATEASQNNEAASIVAEILTRQSVTMAIGNKDKTIETMLSIHQQFPTIDVPLQLQTVEVRHAI